MKAVGGGVAFGDLVVKAQVLDPDAKRVGHGPACREANPQERSRHTQKEEKIVVCRIKATPITRENQKHRKTRPEAKNNIQKRQPENE